MTTMIEKAVPNAKKQWNDLVPFVPLERLLERLAENGIKSLKNKNNQWNENRNVQYLGLHRSVPLFLRGCGGWNDLGQGVSDHGH
jgi:hypothetical protein